MAQVRAAPIVAFYLCDVAETAGLQAVSAPINQPGADPNLIPIPDP